MSKLFQSPLAWVGVALGSLVVGFVGYKATKSSTTPAKPKVEEIKPVIGTADKAVIDENGVVWALYHYEDGSWEGNPLEANPAYVRVFHEATLDDLKFMIAGHAETYNANGTLKLDLGDAKPTTPTTPTPAGGLPDYVPGAKCGSSYCWVLVDPGTALMIPSTAQSSPLNVGDIVSYYIGDDHDAVKTEYLARVTARVTGSKIEDSSSIFGKYPIKIVSSVLLRGKAPTKLPAVGLEMDQYRQGMIAASLVA